MKVYNSRLSSEDATTSCLVGILSRLLCRTFRNCVAREGDESGHVEKAEQKKIGSPGIVARLMGLDSMPVFPYSPPDSLKRSRSANSVESWPGFSSGERSQGVQQIRTYLTLENDEFLLLSFSPENGHGSFACTMKHKESVKQKSNNGDSKIRERSKRRSEQHNLKKKDLPETSCGGINDVLLSSVTINAHRKSSRVADDTLRKKEMPIPLKTKEKWISAQRDVEADQCSSQDSSPVSVLDNTCMGGECSGHSSSPTSGEETAVMAKHQSPRRKMSLKFEDLSCSSSTFHPIILCKEENKKPFDVAGPKSSKLEQVTVDCTQNWGKICMLTEEDLKNAPWISKELCKSDEVKEIAAEVALRVLDPLLLDVVDDIFKNLIYL